jgi:hypothetical protein
MSAAKFLNELLTNMEKQYPLYLTQLGLPDHPAVRIGFIYQMLHISSEDPLQDRHVQQMWESCLQHELNRLVDEIEALTLGVHPID